MYLMEVYPHGLLWQKNAIPLPYHVLLKLTKAQILMEWSTVLTSCCVNWLISIARSFLSNLIIS